MGSRIQKEVAMHSLMIDELARHRVADFHRQAEKIHLRRITRAARRNAGNHH
jgi:hypothetical protein